MCSDFPLLTARSRLPYRLIVLWIMLYERQLSLWLEYSAIQGIIIIIKCSEIKSREPLLWVAHILNPLLEMEREVGMKTQIFQQSMACEVIQFHMPYKTIQSRCSVQFKTITGKTATRRKSCQQLSTQWHQKWGQNRNTKRWRPSTRKDESSSRKQDLSIRTQWQNSRTLDTFWCR